MDGVSFRERLLMDGGELKDGGEDGASMAKCANGAFEDRVVRGRLARPPSAQGDPEGGVKPPSLVFSKDSCVYSRGFFH